MAKVIQFPSPSEKDWRDIESVFRKSFAVIPDGADTLEECLPEIKAAWAELFVPFEVQPNFTIPGPLSGEQETAIVAGVEQAVNLVADRLKKERAEAIALIASKVFMATYYRRNGSTN